MVIGVEAMEAVEIVEDWSTVEINLSCLGGGSRGGSQAGRR